MMKRVDIVSGLWLLADSQRSPDWFLSNLNLFVYIHVLWHTYAHTYLCSHPLVQCGESPQSGRTSSKISSKQCRFGPNFQPKGQREGLSTTL